jgi:hypothetical protein
MDLVYQLTKTTLYPSHTQATTNPGESQIRGGSRTDLSFLQRSDERRPGITTASSGAVSRVSILVEINQSKR